MKYIKILSENNINYKEDKISCISYLIDKYKTKKKTDFDDAGKHTVTITVSDGIKESSETVKVTDKDKNRPPEHSKRQEITRGQITSCNDSNTPWRAWRHGGG